MKKVVSAAALAALTLGAAAGAEGLSDAEKVAALDTAYQAAVERNDADTMAKILHEDMILVVGAGAVYTRDDLLQAARNEDFIYEHQVEDEGTQTVRLYGKNTAIVTARLYIKAMRGDTPVEKRLWFSDTYVRTKDGWRYAFGQASLALPADGAQ